MFPFELNLPEGQASGALWLALALMTLINLLMGVFWIVLGWRAMRAHERLPEVLASKLGAATLGSAQGPQPADGAR